MSTLFQLAVKLMKSDMLPIYGDFLGGSDGKVSVYNMGDLSSIPGLGRYPLEKAMATHSSTIAWKIPWTEEPDGLHSMGSQSRTQLSNSTFHFPIYGNN